jgi:hypothetical protein
VNCYAVWTKNGWLCFTEFWGGFFEKILLNILDIVWADLVKSEKNFFFFLCIMSVLKLSSQAVSTNRLRCKYNKCFRFVKVSSAIPLYVIEIKWIYPILCKIMAWRIALSLGITARPCIYFLWCRLSERYYYLTTNISTCHVYIATLTYTLMTKCDQPFRPID